MSEDIQIQKVDQHQFDERKELLSFLAPHETKALFLLGNLKNSYEPSILYAAKRKGKLVAVCGYYPVFKSVSIYSEDDEASKMLAEHMLDKHHIEALVGMTSMAKPFFDVFLKHGFVSVHDPEQVFLELDLKDFIPYDKHDGSIRTLDEKDVEDAVFLMRAIHDLPRSHPVTDDERRRIQENEALFCLEKDNKIVSMASSNGLAIKAFQILGVSTDPNYRRRGYAKAVCSHLIQHMKKKGAEKVVIFTGKENEAAIKCYLSLGFKVTDTYYMAFLKQRGSYEAV
jgi:predicted GNAT family acetyltransferase